ncbi:14689_t:CDS:1, partial [Racocetra persica]
QKEKPNIVLIETAYYETISGNKDIMDLEKLAGALECLKFHTKSQIIMRQNKLTKDFGAKLKNEEETIPNLFHFSGK